MTTWLPGVREAVVDAVARMVLKDLRERPPAPSDSPIPQETFTPTLRSFMVAARTSFREILGPRGDAWW